jgi:hypothetical protein
VYLILSLFLFIYLWLDNTFSRNTSKTLTFSVALGEGEQVGSSEQTELAGWILKKRRKKMQGNVVKDERVGCPHRYSNKVIDHNYCTHIYQAGQSGGSTCHLQAFCHTLFKTTPYVVVAFKYACPPSLSILSRASSTLIPEP